MNNSTLHTESGNKECKEKKAEEVHAVLDSKEPLTAAAEAEKEKETAVEVLGQRIRELQKEVEQLKSDVHEQEMLRIREQATLQRDKRSFEERTKSAIFLDLLSVVDSFEQLVLHGEKTQEDSSILTGCKAVLGQLNQLLRRNGVHCLEGLEGQPYDASTAEIARVVVDAHTPANAVSRVLRSGYKLGDSLLRPAMVEVASAPVAPPEQKPSEEKTGDIPIQKTENADGDAGPKDGQLS